MVRWTGVGNQQLDFVEFYRSAADECLRAVLVSVGDQDTARELVDEAFARAWASWRTVGRHPAPKAWVVRTALNAGISRWRRHRREVPVPDPARVANPPAVSGASAPVVDPQIMAAVMRLPTRQRQVIALRLILDLDTARTAEVLGIAPGTVMAHMGRAMATLRHDLEPELQQENRS
jgi:RNA polymerase sigma factor (sigma-70 family)